MVSALEDVGSSTEATACAVRLNPRVSREFTGSMALALTT